MEQKYTPHLIAWEITRSCNLSCKHCRADAREQCYQNELTTADCYKLLDNIASFSKPIIILTGGEPMMRDDIYDVAAYGNKLNLRMVMAPCGLLMNEENTARMIKAGIKRISLSIDGASEESHDGFRGVKGAYAGVMQAINICKKSGLEFQINTTVTKYNLGELPKILDLSIQLGAAAYHPFLLVPTGRGKALKMQELSPQEYEDTLLWFYRQRDKVPIKFKPTCAPHYYRIFRQEEKKRGNKISSPQNHFEAMTKGCMGGQTFAFISHMGKVQICGFLEEECGDLKKNNFNFQEIWDTSKVFLEMRNLDEYHGRCGHCEYRKICGGCRARAYAITGDYLDEEPFCTYQPLR